MVYVENPARTEAFAAFMWSKAGVVRAARQHLGREEGGSEAPAHLPTKKV